jgi:hypothetical protein
MFIVFMIWIAVVSKSVSGSAFVDECSFSSDCTGSQKCIQYPEDPTTLTGTYFNKCEDECTITSVCDSGSECEPHDPAAYITCAQVTDENDCNSIPECIFRGSTRQRRVHGDHGDDDGADGDDIDDPNAGTGGMGNAATCEFKSSGSDDPLADMINTCILTCSAAFYEIVDGECVFVNACNTYDQCASSANNKICYHVDNGEHSSCICNTPELGHEPTNDCNCPDFLSADTNNVCTLQGHTVTETFENANVVGVTEEGVESHKNKYVQLTTNTFEKTVQDDTVSVSFRVRIHDTTKALHAKFTLANNETFIAVLSTETSLATTTTTTSTTFTATSTTKSFTTTTTTTTTGSNNAITTTIATTGTDGPDNEDSQSIEFFGALSFDSQNVSTKLFPNMEAGKWHTVQVHLKKSGSTISNIMEIHMSIDDFSQSLVPKLVTVLSPIKKVEFIVDNVGERADIDNVATQTDDTFKPATDTLTTQLDFSELKCFSEDDCPIRVNSEFKLSVPNLVYQPTHLLNLKNNTVINMMLSTTSNTFSTTLTDNRDNTVKLTLTDGTLEMCGETVSVPSVVLSNYFFVTLNFPSFLSSEIVQVTINGESTNHQFNCTAFAESTSIYSMTLLGFTNFELNAFAVSGEYCTNCKYDPATPVTTTPAPASTKKKKTGTIVGIVVGGLVGVVVIIVVCVNKEKLKKLFGLDADFADKSVLDQLIL